MQLKITLHGSAPAIWRRILVPAEYSFFALHVAIQSAMGWTDSHLHGFRIAKKGLARPIFITYPNPDADFGVDEGDRDERKEKVADYLGVSMKQCAYEYDFGDGWVHTVLLERELPAEPGTAYPRCIAGENACPPEDCGGISGYYELLKSIRDPKHSEHAESLRWLGIEDAEEFDPAAFDPQDVTFSDPDARLKAYKEGWGF